MEQQIDVQALLDRINMLESQVIAAKRAATSRLTLKVSEKGALSVYGLGKFPVTLYRSQWERLMDAKDIVLGFISNNSEYLAEKG